MRKFVQAGLPTVVHDNRGLGVPQNLTLQVIGGVPCFFDSDRNNLELTDAGGTPKSGWSLTAAMAPVTLPNFSGVLYARAAALVEIEVGISTAFDVRQPLKVRRTQGSF